MTIYISVTPEQNTQGTVTLLNKLQGIEELSRHLEQIVQTVLTDTVYHVNAIERRLEELEKRVADLEVAGLPAPPNAPAKEA